TRERSSIGWVFDFDGAPGGTRTRMNLPSADFQSAASTNSATRASCIGAQSLPKHDGHSVWDGVYMVFPRGRVCVGAHLMPDCRYGFCAIAARLRCRLHAVAHKVRSYTHCHCRGWKSGKASWSAL